MNIKYTNKLAAMRNVKIPFETTMHVKAGFILLCIFENIHTIKIS